MEKSFIFSLKENKTLRSESVNNMTLEEFFNQWWFKKFRSADEDLWNDLVGKSPSVIKKESKPAFKLTIRFDGFILLIVFVILIYLNKLITNQNTGKIHQKELFIRKHGLNISVKSNLRIKFLNIAGEMKFFFIWPLLAILTLLGRTGLLFLVFYFLFIKYKINWPNK